MNANDSATKHLARSEIHLCVAGFTSLQPSSGRALPGWRPSRTQGAQASPGRPLHTQGSGSRMQEVHSMREDTPLSPFYPPAQPPDADPHNSTSLRLWLQGRGKCERKNKRYFFDLMKGAGPRHLKGLSGHHTSCIQGHFTPTRPLHLPFT